MLSLRSRSFFSILPVVAASLFVVSGGETAEDGSGEALPECSADVFASVELDHIPTTYAGMATLSEQERRYAFGQLEPADQKDLWRTHWDELQELRTYSDEEQAIFEEAKDLLLPVMEDGGAMERLDDVTAFSKKAQDIMGFERAREAFADLGPPQGHALQVAGVSSGMSVFPTTSAEAVRGCGCSQYKDWCSIQMGCASGCSGGSSWGCGTAWIYPCDGSCRMEGDNPMEITD